MSWAIVQIRKSGDVYGKVNSNSTDKLTLVHVVTVKRFAQLLLIFLCTLTGSVSALAETRLSDLELRAQEADLEAVAALEFFNRFQKMAEQAIDEVYFLPQKQRPDALEQVSRLRNAAARARATWHRLNEFSSEIRSQIVAAAVPEAETRPLSNAASSHSPEGLLNRDSSDYDYRIVDAITSDIIDAAIIVEVPTPKISGQVVITKEPNTSPESQFESAPEPLVIPQEQAATPTVGSIGPTPQEGNSDLANKAAIARDLANKALNFAVEIQVEAEQANANLTRFKNFRGKVDKAQFSEIKKNAALLTEEARLAELEYRLLDSQAADLEAELLAQKQ